MWPSSSSIIIPKPKKNGVMEPWHHGLHLRLCWQIASERGQVVQQELVVRTLVHLCSWETYSLHCFQKTVMMMHLNLLPYQPVCSYQLNFNHSLDVLGLVCLASASVTVRPLKFTKVKIPLYPINNGLVPDLGEVPLYPIKIKAIQGHSDIALRGAGGLFASAESVMCSPTVAPERQAAFTGVPVLPT